MGKFTAKLIAFVLGLSMIIGCLDYLSARNEDFSVFFGKITDSSEYSRYNGTTGTVEIIPAINRTRETDQYSKLILGDSVCRQIYNPLQDINTEYCIMGTNRAITMSGQYLLAKEFIENRENVTDVYLIVTLDSFDAYYDKSFGYQYAIMPFVSTDLFGDLDKETVRIAKDSYGSLFLNKQVVELIDYSEVNRKLYLNAVKQYAPISEELSEHVSDHTIRYLKKMDQMCDENGIEFHLLPTPIKDNDYKHDQMSRQMEEFTEAGIIDLVKNYYDSVEYYPEEQFRDEVHLGGEYVERNALNNKIYDLMKKCSDLSDLNTDI